MRHDWGRWGPGVGTQSVLSFQAFHCTTLLWIHQEALINIRRWFFVFFIPTLHERVKRIHSHFTPLPLLKVKCSTTLTLLSPREVGGKCSNCSYSHWEMLLTSYYPTRQSFQENLKPRHQAIARSIWKVRGLRFSRNDWRFEVNKLFIIWFLLCVLCRPNN